MTLSFSQKWGDKMGDLKGQPNYFTEKIWLSLLSDKEYCNQIYDYEKRHVELFDDYFETPDYGLESKLHTIREDKTNRWKAGNDIHFVINNRTKDRFQFAPVVKCKSVQNIEIKEMIMTARPNCIIEDKIYTVKVDNKYLTISEVENLAINDGFPDTKAFFDFFENGFIGKIIHWTNHNY